MTNEVRSYFGFGGDPRPPTQVNPRLWRSGRPTEQTLAALYTRGVRVIIDLEDSFDQIPIEAAFAKKLGFKFYSYPTNAFFQPEDDKIKEIMQLLQLSPGPVLVHCYHGEDRTGLVIGLERVFMEGWKAGQAYDEMLAMGFHPILLGLDQYFRDKVGSF